MLIRVLALALALASSASAKALPPAALQGQWGGTIDVAFGILNGQPTCLTPGTIISVPHSLSFDSLGNFAYSPYPASSATDQLSATAAVRTLSFPGANTSSFYDFVSWNTTLDFSVGVLVLAWPGTSALYCHYASISSDDNPVLTVVTTSGSGTCVAATYTQAVTSAPFCTSTIAGGPAKNMNVVGKYTNANGPMPSAAPSASAFPSASAQAPLLAGLAAASPSPATVPPFVAASSSPKLASPPPSTSSSGAGSLSKDPSITIVLTLVAGVALGALMERRALGA